MIPLSPIELAIQKVTEVMAKTGLNSITETFKENSVLDPRIIQLYKEDEGDLFDKDIKAILKKKKEDLTLQDILRDDLEHANAGFAARMAAINTPTYATRPLMIGDSVKKKRRKARKKKIKG